MLDTPSRSVELDTDLEVWRNLIHMLSKHSVVIQRLEEFSLRLPLESELNEQSEPGAGVVALPSSIDVLETPEQNRGLYRFLTLQVAGRREFGTYANPRVLAELNSERASSPALRALFSVAEAVRVQQCCARAYPGSVRETEELAVALCEVWKTTTHPRHSLASDVLLALALTPREQVAALAPAWLPLTSLEAILDALSVLHQTRANVQDAWRVAHQLLALATQRVFVGQHEADEFDSNAESDSVSMFDGDSQAASQSLGALVPVDGSAADPSAADLDAAATEGEVQSLTLQLDDGTAEPQTATSEASDTQAISLAARRSNSAAAAQSYMYDEWDYALGAYHHQRCHVHELTALTDSGEFFERTRSSYAELLRQVRHHFERIRPERYRPLRGLEDGEDFDLNALMQARILARAGRTPHARVYTARARQARDVATLFLLDMSASTHQPFVEPWEPPVRRIIDTLKETLAIMSMALDDLGDLYAIYGFSSQGPKQVEVYPIKAFEESTTEAVKARIGGIEPKYGTRMGTALRHMLRKFSSVHARSRHLILLSDGYPQDHDYGNDPRSATYGIEDTAVALRELHQTGVTPFCLTVDRAGDDYLRRMCNPDQYMVIHDIDHLPSELPKIYQRVVK